MKKILIVVDMQNDFITGPLGTPEAVEIVDKVWRKINPNQWEKSEWDTVVATFDSHDSNYLETQEGKKLPIKHCIYNTKGRDINDHVKQALGAEGYHPICKFTFGSVRLVECIKYWMSLSDTIEQDYEVTLVGVCTDICVISNALLLKAHFPEMNIIVDASCCAGSTPERHKAALDTMKSCQINVINEEE